MSLVKSSLSTVFSTAVQLKNFAYDQAWVKSQRLPVPVVSVGNLTVGGTGKTPLVIELVKEFISKDIKIGIVSRGYKRTEQGTCEVTLEEGKYFGDEPTLIKRKFPDIPFFVSGERYQAGMALLAKYPEVKLIIMDDGFQHRRLYRDLDIVVVDSTQPESTYEPLPLGRARESLSALARAQFIAITKTNVTGANSTAEILSWIGRFLSHDEVPPQVTAKIALQKPYNIFSGEVLETFGEVDLISAIGLPQVFEDSLKSEFGCEVGLHHKFPDHHFFSKVDLHFLKGSRQYLTTEKDAVKLKKVVDGKQPIYAVPMTFVLDEGKEKLFEDVIQLIS